MYDIIIFFFNDTATTEIYTLSLHDAPSDLKKNCFTRKKLSMEEIKQEVKVLERMGHKRLALEAGEDPVNCPDRKGTRLNSSHANISYAVFCLKKKTKITNNVTVIITYDILL